MTRYWQNLFICQRFIWFQSINCLLINGREKVGVGKKSKTFIDYSQTFDDAYDGLEDYNPIKEWKVLIVFDDMIADMDANQKLGLIVTKLFPRVRKPNIWLTILTQSA